MAAETARTVRTADWWGYTPCRCHNCVSKTLAPGTVCPCIDCQPGRGRMYGIMRSVRHTESAERARQRRRLIMLLNKTGPMNDAESTEFQVLLDTLSHPEIIELEDELDEDGDDDPFAPLHTGTWRDDCN